jgi:hypothetical protein
MARPYQAKFFPERHGLSFFWGKDEETVAVDMIVYGSPRCHVGSGELSRQEARRLRDFLNEYLSGDPLYDPATMPPPEVD